MELMGITDLREWFSSMGLVEKQAMLAAAAAAFAGLLLLSGLVHLLVLIGFVVAGGAVATVTFDRRLRP